MYNQRRGEGVNNVGMRRNAPISNNFVAAGQLAPQNRQPRMQAPPRQAINPCANVNIPQTPPLQQRLIVNKPPEIAPQPVPPVAPPAMEVDVPMEEVVDKKTFWAKKVLGKVPKRERVRRRNVRLGKILQPKNAVMILNELVTTAIYSVTDTIAPTDMNVFTATVTVNEISHVGTGRSKNDARGVAAEAALKYIVKNRQFPFKTEDAPMAETDEAQPSLPWQHVASFALFKLLNAWGEDLSQTKVETPTEEVQPALNKPAKVMPENAAKMNPLMLINQMLPHALFEEIDRVGISPNTVFRFKCVVDGLTFTGSGPNKKAAKRMVAFEACHKILGVEYDPADYTPSV